MCAAFRPDKLNPIWKTLPPATIRTMIYRAILGCPGFEKLNEAAWYAHELLVMAELHPPVWGHPSTRTLEQQKVMHTVGLCISCHHVMKFPDGDIFPFKSYCKECVSNPRRRVINVHPTEIPFWGNSCTWPVKYQEECINYAIKNRIFVDKVRPLDLDSGEYKVPTILAVDETTE